MAACGGADNTIGKESGYRSYTWGMTIEEVQAQTQKDGLLFDKTKEDEDTISYFYFDISQDNIFTNVLAANNMSFLPNDEIIITFSFSQEQLVAISENYYSTGLTDEFFASFMQTIKDAFDAKDSSSNSAVTTLESQNSYHTLMFTEPISTDDYILFNIYREKAYYKALNAEK
jgi:hypothetical protein